MYAFIWWCHSHRLRPSRERFLSKIPETAFELVPLGCHNVSFQSPQCFLQKDFLSSSAASLGHQNNLLCFTEPPLCTSLQLTKSVYYKINAKVNPPKGARPLSVRNEIKWWIDRKSPASVLFPFHF